MFRYPKDRSLDYIKRIVGVPGDTLEMRNKVLYRNGVEVQEPYTQHSQPLIMIPGRDNWGPITVPADKFFALGDNRDDSADSRFWGFLDRNDIRGKAWLHLLVRRRPQQHPFEQDRESRRVGGKRVGEKTFDFIESLFPAFPVGKKKSLNNAFRLFVKES